MKLTVNTNHLALIDRVVEAGMLGKSRGDVLKGAVIEHALSPSHSITSSAQQDRGLPVGKALRASGPV